MAIQQIHKGNTVFNIVVQFNNTKIFLEESVYIFILPKKL